MSRLQMRMTVANDVANNTPPPHGLPISLVARLIKPLEIDMGGDIRSSQPRKPTQVQVTQGPNGPVISFETDTRGCLPVMKHSEDYKVAVVMTNRDEGIFMTFYQDCIMKAAQNMGCSLVFHAPKP